MNETMNVILTRRSVRKYTDEMPKKEDLEQIIQAGLYAASGKGGQSSIIVAVTDKALRDRLMEMNRKVGGWAEGFDPFYGAPAVLLVLAKKNTPFTVADGSLSMGNMMLAAHALGLGSCWINRAREEFETEEGREILRSLGVEGEYEGVGHCVVGYAADTLPQPAPRKDGRVFWAE
ncbi:MAG: nitroreductase [Oscillospiraceae bacterium]|nr:nitroreductase [Oscillospiraceae bacterium]